MTREYNPTQNTQPHYSVTMKHYVDKKYKCVSDITVKHLTYNITQCILSVKLL